MQLFEDTLMSKSNAHLYLFKMNFAGLRKLVHNVYFSFHPGSALHGLNPHKTKPYTEINLHYIYNHFKHDGHTTVLLYLLKCVKCKKLSKIVSNNQIT